MSKFKRSFLIEQYIFSVKTKLLFSRKRKKEIIENFRDYIYSCIEEESEPVDCKQDLYRLFGTSDKAAENFMEMRDRTEANDYEREYKRRKIIILLLVLLFLLIITFLVCNRIISNNFVDKADVGTLESSLYEEEKQ